MLNTYKPYKPWAQRCTVSMWILIRKQAGGKLKAEQLCPNHFQHRQAANIKHQTTCPMHWSSSKRSIYSSLLAVFLAAGMAGLPTVSLTLDECSDGGKPSPTSSWLRLFPLATHFVPLSCQCQARQPGAGTHGTWQTTAMPRHDYHTCHAGPVCPAQGIGWPGSKYLSCPATEIYLRAPWSALHSSHVPCPKTPSLLTKWLHNLYFCHPLGDRTTSPTTTWLTLSYAFYTTWTNNFTS